MAITYPDVAVWPHVRATAGGVETVYDLGDELAAAVTAAEVAQRAALRAAGAIKLVASGASADWDPALEAAAAAEAARTGASLPFVVVGGTTYVLTP